MGQTMAAERSLFHLASMTPTRVQRVMAVVVCLLNLCFFSLAVPYAKQMGPEITPFLPSFVTMVLLFDLMTAFLLYSQFRVTRLPSLAVLASTYLFTGLVTIPHILTFPGVFSPTGLLGAGPQSAVWLWVLWHGGFPLGILAYCAVEARWGNKPLSRGKSHVLLFSLLILVPVLVGALGVWVTVFQASLPMIVQKGNYNLLWTSGVGPVVLGLNVLAAGMVLKVTKGRSVLQLWLFVSVLALLLDVTLTLLAGSRYSIGWYVARMNSLVSASIVLAALLLEITSLYVRLVQQEKSLKYQALHDSLTSLPNRAHFAEVLEERLLEVKVQGGQGAILFIDLDGFKQVNDSKGHDCGDLLLIEVAKRLLTCVRANDLVARMGGDEFTVILRELSDVGQIEQVAKRIVGRMSEPFCIRDQELTISASVGGATFPADGQDSVTLMKRADTAMYRAKEQGKNRYWLFDGSEVHEVS